VLWFTANAIHSRPFFWLNLLPRARPRTDFRVPDSENVIGYAGSDLRCHVHVGRWRQSLALSVYTAFRTVDRYVLL
jgi:hypothetical protein